MSEPSAVERAAQFLAMRQYSRRGLYRKLVQKGICEDDAEAAVERMEELGLLDDTAYGKHIIAASIQKGYGPLRMEQALFRAEIPQSIRQQLLDEISDGQEAEWAHNALRKLCRDPKDLADPAARRKLANKLYRNGYNWNTIQSSLRTYMEEVDLDLWA